MFDNEHSRDFVQMSFAQASASNTFFDTFRHCVEFLTLGRYRTTHTFHLRDPLLRPALFVPKPGVLSQNVSDRYRHMVLVVFVPRLGRGFTGRPPPPNLFGRGAPVPVFCPCWSLLIAVLRTVLRTICFFPWNIRGTKVKAALRLLEFLYGGRYRNRTCDLMHVKHAL